MAEIVDLVDVVLTAVNGHLADLESPEYLAVLEKVRQRVHMMTSGRPLNRY